MAQGASMTRAMRAYETSWECDGENICITSKMAVTAPVVQPVLCIETTWTIRPNGLLTAKMRVEKIWNFRSCHVSAFACS